mmetsp:Transcript_29363/g.63856  ORF Transcript_29363/g.63856 Transcript_29363/m.63856 type:complete len:362 (+) Transcript_29363:43-1128(+)
MALTISYRLARNSRTQRALASLTHLARCPATGQRRTFAKVVIVNASKYDRGCEWKRLEQVAEVVRFDDSTPAEFSERANGADVLITKELPVGADLIARFPSSIKGICEAGTGYNNIDLTAASERGIVVCNVPTYSNEAVAALVMTYVLNFSCSMFEQQKRLFDGNRASFTTGMAGGGGTVIFDLPHRELRGQTIGLIGGGGNIGLAVADLANAFGMRVIISDLAKPRRDNVEWVSLEDLLAQSDYVSIHCPLFPSTRHLMDAPRLKMMRPTAFLINCSRGPIVKEVDLIAELNKGTIAGAALDVQEVEPVPEDSPLFSTPNLVLSPHIGWQRLESRQKLVNTTADNVAAILKGKPQNVVSP